MTHSLSVTVLLGSSGTDGSQVVEGVLKNSKPHRLTAIVPKKGRRRKKTGGKTSSILPTTERLVRLGEGCACCTVRGDLLTKIRRIAESDSADQVLIQTGPAADLSTVAKTFSVADQSGAVLSDVAQLQSVAMAIDARDFMLNLKGKLARPLVVHIELANVIVLEQTVDLASDDVEEIRNCILALNPDVQIVLADRTELSIASLQSTDPFDLNAPKHRAMRNVLEPTPEGPSAIVRLSYQARRPFHPSRLHRVLHEEREGLLRVTGTFWVATQPDLVGSMDWAGGSRETSCSGMWWVSVPDSQRPKSPEFRQYVQEIWHPDFGDRHQDLLIVAIGIDEEGFRHRLDQCLLSDAELADPAQWTQMKDPFQWPKMRA